MNTLGRSIRSVGPADLPMLAALHRAAFRTEAWDEHALADILAMPAAGGLLVANDGLLGPTAPQSPPPETLGFLLFTIVAEDAELLTLAVLPEARRRGVGGALVQEFLALAAAAGARQALLEVAIDNPVAQRLYGRLGFMYEATRNNYYRRPGSKHVSAHLLRLPLLPKRDNHRQV
jgi:ribosomal-protein-alanine N-acetyltransferase